MIGRQIGEIMSIDCFKDVTGKIVKNNQNKRYRNKYLGIFLFWFLTALLVPNISFAETQVPGGNISEDTTWTLAGSPYIVNGAITVSNADAAITPTLTIEPGVEIRFAKGANHLKIGSGNSSGALVAQGTVDAPIVFTSNETTPASGDWQGIIFDNGTDDTTTILEHAVVEYGGAPFRTVIGYWVDLYSNILLYNASPTIRNTSLRNSQGVGLYGLNSTSTLDAMSISDSGTHGIQLNGSSSTITNSMISNSGQYGIYCSSNTSNPSISSNIFSNWGTYPLRLGPGSILSNNTYSGNGARAIEIFGGNITSDASWSNTIQQYIILSSISVSNADAAITPTLTIEPGVEIRFAKGANHLKIGSGN